MCNLKMSSQTTENCYFLQKITKDLSKLLTNDEKYTTAFRIHTTQLQSLGELSFQTNLDFAAWKQLDLQPQSSEPNIQNIFNYASKQHSKLVNEETIPQITQENDSTLKVVKCVLIKTNGHLFIDRMNSTKMILGEILSNDDYGSYKLDYGVSVIAQYDKKHDLNVSDLRIKILHEIISNFVEVKDNNVEVLLTTKSSDIHKNKILCGCVLSESGQKASMTASELYEEYASNMRMMFEHKYGVRNITAQANWKTKIDKLGHAAVTFQMIQNTPPKTIALSSKHHVIKNAAFVIYNGARIASILRRFQAEFSQKLPNFEDIDFSNLKLNEEWELIYAYLAYYPTVIKNCVCLLKESKVNFHNLYEFLVHFATAFSVYYSRIKILTEAKEHLLPTLYARIYLLRCVERVLQHAVRLLNIELVNQM